MIQLSKRIINFFPYTRKRSSTSIDIKRLGHSAEEVTKNFLSLVDIDTLYRIVKFANVMSDKINISKLELKEQLQQLVLDSVSAFFKSNVTGLYTAEYVSLFLHKTKSGKAVITIYNNIEL